MSKISNISSGGSRRRSDSGGDTAISADRDSCRRAIEAGTSLLAHRCSLVPTGAMLVTTVKVASEFMTSDYDHHHHHQYYHPVLVSKVAMRNLP
jgi:hypothetical protein